MLELPQIYILGISFKITDLIITYASPSGQRGNDFKKGFDWSDNIIDRPIQSCGTLHM